MMESILFATSQVSCFLRYDQFAMLICGRIFSPETLEHIQQLVDDISRRALSRRVCELLAWRHPDGRIKDMSSVSLWRLSMRHRLFISTIALFAVIFSPLTGFSAEVDMATVRQVAAGFLDQRVARFGKWGGTDKPTIAGIELISYKDTPVAFNVSINPRGHLLIPFDDELSPVLLYSDTSDFIPSRIDQKGSIESWILPEVHTIYSGIKRRRMTLGTVRELTPGAKRAARAWGVFKGVRSAEDDPTADGASGEKYARVGPLLTTTWSQGSPYNQYTPGITGSCTHTYTGCVATAWAQLVKYWNWPDYGVGSHFYYWTTGGLTLSADFEHAYDWSSMPNNLTGSSSEAEKDAVARLMSDMGIAANMNYGCSGSGSSKYADAVLDLYFKYKSSMQKISRGSYSATDWLNFFKVEFDSQPARPIILSIFTTSGGGHEVVADGYETGTTDMVHINLGWSGSYNGYYDVTQDFTTGPYTWDADTQVIVTHIEPDYPLQKTLSVTIAGSGTVTSDPVGIACPTNCSAEFDAGSVVTLSVDPDDFWQFTGWSGACSGTGGCTLTMNANNSVTATFDFYTAHKSRIGDTASYNSTLQASYDGTPNPGTVKAWATDFVENLTCNLTKDVTLKGGYNEGYTSNSDYTTLQGVLSIPSGSLTVENLVIR
jgi:hypothetical protein